MNEKQIIALFQEKVNIRGIGNKAGLTKAVIYDYRKRAKLSLGDMLDFLYKIDAIRIIAKYEPEKREE